MQMCKYKLKINILLCKEQSVHANFNERIANDID